MAENKFVLDASVAIKWALKEKNGSREALIIKRLYQTGELDLFTTGHFFFEVCNVVFRKAPEGALPFLSQLRMMGVIECRLTELQALKAFELMQNYPKVSFYDASYHALAICEHATFITADEKYYETTKKEGHILLLRNFTL